MKCHSCHQEMRHLNNCKWTLSCPDRHCHVTIINNEIKEYCIHYYPNQDRLVRYNIEQTHYYGGDHISFTKHTKVPKTKLNRRQQPIQIKARREYKLILKMDKFIPLKMDNDIIQAKAMYEKLTLYNLFS
jgi:hypothetical protein